MQRRKFLGIAAAGCAPALVRAVVASAPRTRQPNIVLLFVDDLGLGDVKYRRARLRIPNLLQLESDGMTFTDAYAASPTCSPSRASVITGQHPARLHMVRHIPGGNGEFHVVQTDPVRFPSRNWLPRTAPTLARVLKPMGYRTAFVGKWHLGPEPYYPVHQGFDEQHGITDFGNPRSYYPPFFGGDCPVYKDAAPESYLTDRLTDDAIGVIERNGQSKEPFLLTLFYYGVHAPHVGRRDLVAELAKTGLKGAALHHAAMLAAVDESVGRIRRALERQGIADNTVVLFAGDQGGPFPNAPLRGGKKGGTALYEGGARIPFIVHWPGVTRPGSSSAVPVMTTDVLPTLAAMAGGDAAFPFPLDGVNLVPLLTGKAADLGRRDVFMYRSYEDQYAAVRSGDWKLIAYRSGKVELFNLKDDLSEERECSAAHPGLSAELKARLTAWEKQVGVWEQGQAPLQP